MANKPSIPKGTRDFTPAEMVNRNYIFSTIETVFKRYGYQPIETPAMENLTTLLGKYGTEGDKLLFKILNSGNYLDKVPEESLINPDQNNLTQQISEKGLRYDLTVPFARYVVQHRNEISFPFKRYQIQPVWRADRPQKGRYREFFQCDVDVIGSNALLNEVELVQIIGDVFSKLKIKITTKLNNRKVLQGIAEYIGESNKFTEITVAIDKLEKVGKEGVKNELIQSGISAEKSDTLLDLIAFIGSSKEKIDFLEKNINSETGQKGIAEIKSIFQYLNGLNLLSDIDFDLTLARGLNYYTGAIIEVVAKDVKMGSICGGGRYDDLTGIFGLPDVSGVGISFGADRIYDVLSELNLFPDESADTTQVLFVNFGQEEERYCLPLVNNLREAGINTELFPDQAKMKKQMTYANNNNIRYVVLIGANEMANNQITVKDMDSGLQMNFSTIDDLIELITS